MKLNSRQNDCINFLKEKGEITTIDYSKMFNITLITARQDIMKLVRIGIMERMGDTNNRFYRLRKK